ncbi:Kinesin-like protein KIN-14J [Sesamum angolense]|uniref:Kinesin-like protein KIN-14J n=1 Tax=Sesamum angolense TaxID=2727404 RepID=A0AAE1W9Z7_9LAMI|nr:Kinesin-like protein KIN-14J [Sesamum angolense]
MHPIVSFNLHTLGIWNTSQPNGLAVPDASLHTVKSTADVLELMKVGLTNRAVGATALNERSSRSHSILTIHVRGTELETNAILRGCLHLVDLAGSERVDRSEATGGQAKTLMFVQLNPDVESYSETISTLKFAERVSGVELGAARSNKEGRGVRELMEQVASLKDAVAKKDEEIAQLRSHKPNGNDERQGVVSPRYGSSSARRHSLGGVRPNERLSGRKSTSEKAASDLENSSEYSDKHSEAGSQQSMDEFKHHKEFFLQSRLAVVGGAENFSEDIGLKFDLADGAKNINDDVELFGFGDEDSEERLSDISDGVLSMGTETDGSINSIIEYTLFPETPKPTVEITEKPNVPSQLPRPPMKQGQSGTSSMSVSKSSSKIPSSRKATASSSSALKPPKRWQ